MGIMKEVFCSECGKEAKLLFRTKLADKKYLCRECSKLIPFYVKDTFKSEYSLEDYRKFKQYIAYSNSNLRNVFKETDDFYLYHLDYENGLFYIGDDITAKTIFFRLIDVEFFELRFTPKEFKEGVFNSKVRGEISSRIELSEPHFCFEEVLADNAKAIVVKSLFSRDIQYSNPVGMDEFLERFWRARDIAIDKEIERISSELESESADDVNLQKALALFMFDSLEEVTLENLKSQRNKLIKVYHPDASSDNNTGYSQKINLAYETIYNHLTNV